MTKENTLGSSPDNSSSQFKARELMRLNELFLKTQEGVPLSRADLAILYEIDKPINGFESGQKIKELKAHRNPETDLRLLWPQEEIAADPDDLSEKTKVYVGPLSAPGIFNQLGPVEYIYNERFPSGQIRRLSIEYGGQTHEELLEELNRAKIFVSRGAMLRMHNPDFHTHRAHQFDNFVILKVRDLGISGNPRTNEVYTKAKALGLDLCSEDAVVSMLYALRDTQIEGHFKVGMRRFSHSITHKATEVFGLSYEAGRLGLFESHAGPDHKLIGDDNFIFSLH